MDDMLLDLFMLSVHCGAARFSDFGDEEAAAIDDVLAFDSPGKVKVWFWLSHFCSSPQ